MEQMAQVDFLEKIQSDLTTEIAAANANVLNQQKHVQCLELLLTLVQKEYNLIRQNITQ